ncbi:MAG TPA: amino acid adenylation domain-containing protein [Thermoanaerobaculia bacterium]|nr:amino acid adenylation domain-containing protein [Thermoanaerobaculia bacterium]
MRAMPAMPAIPSPEWNATRVGYPLGRTLHEWIEDQVDRAPDAVAVIAEEGRLTYTELEARANRLARHLRGLGVGPETRVGICAERSLELVTGLLAILKSGGAYVPLDPGYPRERLSYLLEDAAVPVLLVQERLEERLPAVSSSMSALRVRLDPNRDESPERPEPLAGPDNLAYVIYTSGSTGRPKGAMNAHRGICNRLLWMQEAYRIGPDDRVLQKTPFSFDVSVWELFWPLMTGAPLVMARPGGHQDAAYLADLIVREGVTTLHFVPPMLRAFLEEPGAGSCAGTLRRVICSGEALPVDVQRRFFARLPGVELHNLYGPTEAAVDVTWWPCDPASTLATVPIGRPVANTTIHILGPELGPELDPELRPVPVGEAGELYIGGVQVGRGYLNRPELTAERFVPDPFEPGARFYRTGDLARHLSDGAVEFLGRIDFQVKIRGFRIELGEIEAALDEHPGVEGSVVVAADGPGGDKRLVAYLRPDHGQAAAVRRWLGLEREGRLEDQSFHELPDGTVVAQRGRGETDFLWEEIFADRSYLRHGIGLRDGDCVFDVGANIGLFSLFAGREAAVRIHAFEPIPPVFETLRVNAALHGLDVRLHDCGLAEQSGSAELTYYPHASLISGRFADAAEEREVVRGFLLGQDAGLSERQIEELLDERLQAERHTCHLRTLSEVIAEEGIERIDLLKVDVEKSELEVLHGLREEDWPRVRQVVVEVHDIEGRLEQALDLLRKHGFEVAVEQDRMLTRTGLYNLYARREERPESNARPRERAWTSPGQLIRDVKESLRERLPEHMIPSAFVLLEDFPLSPNGKVDRKALPAPESVRHAAEREHVAPRTPAEQALAAIWREILGVERIGAGDSFLDLGGHSLLATQVIARVRDGMGVELSLRDLFERPVLSELATLTEERGRAGGPSSPIVAVPRTGDLPLSFSQERVWFLQQLDPTIQSYQFQAKIRFCGKLNPEALRRSLEEIVRRHEIFRTSYPTVDGGPVQRFHPAWEVPLPGVDLSGLPADLREDEAERVLFLECRKLFDIGVLPLVRWTLIRLAPEEHVWLHVEHHLVHDGWSFNRLVGELAVLYRAFVEGRPSPLPDLPLQFADWAVWQREWMRGPEAAAQIEWWKRTLAGRPRVLELPTDRPRPRRQSFRGRVERLEMPLDLCESLRAASRREGVSLYMLMQAAFAALLSRWSGQEQVNVGSAVANRRWRETESMIGMIVDNVVLADDLSGDPTVAELLRWVRRVSLDAGIRQDIPFDHVVEAVQPERDLSYNPLFQASFSFHDSPLDKLDFPGLEAELAEGLSNGSAKFDLNVICIPRSEQRRRGGGGITLLWEYATALFDRSTMERMIGHFYRLLAGFAEHSDRRVFELPMLDWEEERQLDAWSGKTVPFPDGRVHELVEAWADRMPEALAVADGKRSLTYAELEAGANRLARRLMRLGVRPEDRVGVCLERSADLPLALLGVLKAGAAYLPLDPSHPPERLAYILEDSAVRVLLSDLDGLEEESAERPHVPGAASNLAYVIYTSGSTGRPKGTELAHAGLLNLIAWHQRAYGITPADRTTQVASPAFDASVWEIWPTLAGGASLHFPPEDVRSSPPDLLAWLAGEGITVCFLPTPLAEACLALDLPEGLALRALLTGGDRLHRIERGISLRRPFRLVNHYGPTEGTVVTTAGEVGAEPAPPIGRPIDNFRVHVLDRHLQRVPVGVAGELCAGGIGLARGYLGRPELTAERFIPDPFGEGERLYRTGDLVRWRRDGRIDFVGRTDHQVKIRGFRIELGEIEGVLREHPGVRDAVVTVREQGGERVLVGYLTPCPPLPSPTQSPAGRGGTLLGLNSEAEGTVLGIRSPSPGDGGLGDGRGGQGVRSFLADRLPAYMVPSTFVVLPELPLSPNGKIDLAALPVPEPERAMEEKAAPRTPTEEMLAVIWAQVLGLPTAAGLGPEDDFFALGGHSLLATQVLSRIRESFRVEPQLRAVFESPTLEGLGRVVEAALRAGSGPEAPPLVPVPRDGELPLSFAQERLWFLHQFGTDSAVYNIPEAWRLQGRVDAPALERSFNEVVRRHEVLRTTYPIETGRVIQSIAPALHVDLAMVDLRTLERQEPEVRRLVDAEAALPFDLARGPLIRTTLLRLAPEEHVLLITQHHIVSDGWSMGLFVRELAALYRAFCQGEPSPVDPDGRSPLAPLPFQYADFARWQRDWLRGEVLARQLSYWKERLDGAPALLELPTDRPRPSVQTFRGADRTLTIPAGLARGLEELSRQQGVSLFMTLLAAFQLLLSRYTGREDVVAGTPIANRNRYETEGLVGFFVNTLVLRTDLSGDPDLPELLRRVRDVSLDAYAHQDVPFEKLVEELRPERGLSHTPLFQVLFALHNALSMELELPGLTLSRLEPEGKTSKFDLAFHVQPRRDGSLSALARFNRDLFDGTTMDRLLRHFVNLLEGVVLLQASRPGARLSELSPLGETERWQMLAEWNDTEAGFPECALHEPFEARARENPDAPALEFEGEVMTYGELDRRAGCLARRLAALGAGPGDLIGIHLDRSFDKVVAVLGALKSGAAYVPLETSWPRERLRWIVSFQGIERVITHASRREGLIEIGLPGEGAVCLDEPGPEAAVLRLAGPDDLAYVIFTSGSTGTPKGVMVRHRPAVNLVYWVNTTFQVGPSDRLLFVTALSFDLSVYDLLGILAAGGTVRIATRAESRDPRRLVQILAEEGITFWDSAPATLQQLVQFFPASGAVPPSLRLVFLSGDWIPVTLPDRVRESFPGARVVSLGGATEATIWSNYHPVGEVNPAWKSIPYGRPIANARYHVLDAGLSPCPIGVPGDLYISGPCLSLGYAKAPDLTADRYVPDPVGPEPGGRLYRTGDRARYWMDGTLEFLGRLDSQVKVRGYRIELGEIESVVASYPGVREAVALVREDVPGDQRLVAYLIPEKEAAPPSAAELRAWTAERLPEYMVPAAFVSMVAWPLSATGKLDRKSLPPPFAPKPEQPVVEPPRTELERVIAAVWREVIGVESVGASDNFFDLGGHSLLLARVQVRLSEILGRDLPMVDLFRYPTVGSLAEALGTGERDLVEAPAPRPRTHDRVAVVGMAGRFPGARDVDELWQNLRDGVESIRFFTEEELFAAGVHPDLLADPAYVKARGVLEGTDLFDAALFETTPREAQILDPQQRLFLECAWQALEHAGCNGERWRGEVGVFAGASENTYVHQILANPALLSAVGRYSVSLANNPDYLATRVSYKLNLQGPGLAVQTACSTALVAVHLACRALLQGECDLAVAGGVSVRVPEQAGYLHEEGGIASPDGHTRAFDARAAGTVRSSGVGAVVLKRLEDALAEGDTVHAVILGSAINNDGSCKVGFTAPAVDGQARAIRKAHLAAGIDPETIGYVEAHGTGTSLGDPIEMAGLTEAFRAGGATKTGFCAVGTVKSNLGHTDAAAGIAGLLKTVLALEHGQIPPSLHFESPNPAIDFASSPFYVASELREWTSEGPRRAGVSSFGIGGTNAHVVLEEAPPPAPVLPGRPVQLLVLSAATSGALDAATADLARHLETLPDEDLADAAWTLQAGRKALRCRRAVPCRSRAEAIGLLRTEDPARLLSRIVPADPLSVAFLFPGQGAQHLGMAEELYVEEPVFREAMDEACERLRPELGLDLRELLYPSGTARSLDETSLAQPALFAVEHALARLWMSWGVKPEAMLGHSVGEYVAACLAGVFSLEAGLRLVAARGRLMQEQPPGAMLAVPLPESDIAEIVLEGSLSLAAVNAPRACVVAGTAEDVRAFRERLGERFGEELDCRVLHTSHAFHSALMDPVLEPFTQLLRGMELRPPRIPFVSNRTGTWITADEAVSPGYWAGHLRNTVRFADGLKTLLGAGRRMALLEVGPGGTLGTLAGQHPDRKAADLVARSLRRPKEDRRDLDVLLGALGRLWLAGADVDWSAVHAGERRRRIPLPTYPFERRRFWVDPPVTVEGTTLVRRLEAEAETMVGGPVVPMDMEMALGTRTPLEETVTRVWRELLGLDDIGLHDDFFDIGGSSLMGLQMSARLRRALGVPLPGDLLLEAPTVSAMAKLLEGRLAGGAEAVRPTCLLRLQSEGHRPPLFLVHQVGGYAYTFRALSRELGNDRPVYGLRSLGLEEGEEPLLAIEDMARHYLGLIREVQGKGPYLLGGASMGGMVAFEMAHQLQSAGEEVALLALMDTPCLDQMPAREGHPEAVAAVFRGRVELCPNELRRLGSEDQLAMAFEKARQAGHDGLDPAEMARRVRVLAANVDALYTYAPRPHPGSMVYFRAESRRPGDPPRPELPWIELMSGGTEVHVVPGDHMTMHEPPHVRTLAERLRRCLGRVVEMTSPPVPLSHLPLTPPPGEGGRIRPVI